MNYFLALLRPYEVSIAWRRGRFPGFWVSQGLLQGHPVSALLYLVAIDPWLRMMHSALAPPCALAAYVDDTQITVASVEQLQSLVPPLALAGQAMNLKLAWEKCKIVPLGPRPELVAARFGDVLGADSPLISVEVCDGARDLGFYFGRGDVYPDQVALASLRAKLPLLGDQPLGTAMNLMLLRACILSSVTHILRLSTPSPELQRTWENACDRLATSPRKWLRPFLPHAKALFRLPCAILPISLVHEALVMSYLVSSKIDVLARWESLNEHWGQDDSLLLHPLGDYNKEASGAHGCVSGGARMISIMPGRCRICPPNGLLGVC